MRSSEHILFLLSREKPCMRTLVASDTTSSLGTCSKLLSHGRVIYQIGTPGASEKSHFSENNILRHLETAFRGGFTVYYHTPSLIADGHSPAANQDFHRLHTDYAQSKGSVSIHFPTETSLRDKLRHAWRIFYRKRGIMPPLRGFRLLFPRRNG